MEGIDFALLIQIFKGFKSTLPRPSPLVLPIFAGRAGARPGFCGAGRGGVHIPGADALFFESCSIGIRYTALTLQMCGIDIT